MARSIKLFQWILKMYRIIGIYPSSPSQLNQNFFENCKMFIVLMSMVILFVASVAFIFFEAQTTAECAVAFSESILLFTITVFFLIFMVKINNIVELIGKFENFIEMRMENPDSMAMYTEFNEKIEQFCKWVFIILVYVTNILSTTSLLLTSYINYYVLDLKDQSFALTTPVMLPFNWRTPLGYLIAELSEAASFTSLLLCVTPTLCFYAAPCWLFITFAKDIENDLELLSIGGASNRSHEKMRERFGKIIQLYTGVKQLIDEFNGIFEYITFGYFLWTLLGLSCYALLLLSQLSEDASSAEILGSLINVGFSFGAFFIYCESGERVTYQFNQFNENFCQRNWYSFPIEMQRIYGIFLVGVQQSVIVEGYANTVCTRDAFKKTINAGFSYLMMLRRIDG